MKQPIREIENAYLGVLENCDGKAQGIKEISTKLTDSNMESARFAEVLPDVWEFQ